MIPCKKPNCRNSQCPNRHASGEKSTVCKHWLRGLCKKGDNCQYLHEYNLRKMPVCSFFSTHGACNSGDECQFLHLDPSRTVKECVWYARGFCKLGTFSAFLWRMVSYVVQ